MKRLRAFLVAVLMFGLLALIPMGCSDNDSGSSPVPPTIPTNRVYVTTMGSGILTPVVDSAAQSTVSGTDQNWNYTLTFENITENILWYTDRPERKSGTESMQDYVALWPKIYGEVSPNAVLDGYLSGEVLHDGLYLTLKEPLYDAGTNSLTFQVTLLGSTMIDPYPIDPVDIYDIKLTVFDNTPEGEVNYWSFGETAQEAVLEPTDTEGFYKLTLNGVYPELYQLQNAPGTRYEILNAESLEYDWPQYFGTDSPNASLTGLSLTNSGEMQVVLLELSNPSHEGDKAYYDARVIGGQVLPNDSLMDATLLIDSPDGAYPLCSRNGNEAKCYGNCFPDSTSLCCPEPPDKVTPDCHEPGSTDWCESTSCKSCANVCTTIASHPPAPGAVELRFSNDTEKTVHIGLNITNGPITVCEPHVYVKDLGDFCDVSNDNDHLCVFSLTPGQTKTVPNPQGICLSGAMGLGGAPACPGAPPTYAPDGTLESEFTVNGQGDNTVDLSLVDGISGIITVSLVGDWWYTDENPKYPGDKTKLINKSITAFTNKRKGENIGNPGVFPYHCQDCTSMISDQCGDPKNPDQKCQTYPICNVNSSSGTKGSATYTVKEYDLKSN